jgi:uncharacterized protein
MMRLPAIIIFIYLMTMCAQALDVPEHDSNTRLVTDLTATLSSSEKDRLAQKLRAIEQSDGTQITVLLIPTLAGDDLFDFSHRTFQKWGIGDKSNNNGVLFLVAKNDRKMRIHVGYGLEGRLTDALSSRIMRNEVQPEFYNGRFFEGIERGVSAIIEAVKGEYVDTTAATSSSGSGDIGFWIMLTVLIVFFVLPIFLPKRARRRRRASGYAEPWFTSGGWTSGGSGGGWGGSSGGGWSSGSDSGTFGGGSSGGGGASGSW